MALVRWEPFRELAALQNEMGRWMNMLSGGPTTPGNGHSSTWLPAVDVWETDSELVLSFDLPGIPEDKISVELDDNVLTVSGERERAHEHSSERFYRFERRFGSFTRSVTLPAGDAGRNRRPEHSQVRSSHRAHGEAGTILVPASFCSRASALVMSASPP